MPNLNPIRRAQLISPFGVGAIVNFPGDESRMTAGLDEWPFARQVCPADWRITEERLQSRLNVSHFRLPPEYRERDGQDQHSDQHIPFIRFPRWHYCPFRGAMQELSIFGPRQRCSCEHCGAKAHNRRPWLIPMRFIAACPNGHIEDFPFMEWVHRNGGWDEAHRLRFLAGRSSAGLSGSKLRCNCGQEASMAGAFDFDRLTGGALQRIGYGCSGNVPWLGEIDGITGSCDQYLRVVQRGASNVYFPFTVSSIYLPPGSPNESRTINKVLDNALVWNTLTSGMVEGKYIEPIRCEIVAQREGVDADELLEAAQRRFDGVPEQESSGPSSDEQFRRQEYEVLQQGRTGETTELMVEVFESSGYGRLLGDKLSRVGLARKLRETRVLVGFSRLLPAEDLAPVDRTPIAKNANLGWLPAITVRGEGIFLEFSSQRIEQWAANPLVQQRARLLSDQLNDSRLNRGLAPMVVPPKLILLHTFAHAMIEQLSFDCGYGSSALRERIYCDREENDKPMQGVLLYTASGDSEGTLGGLVRQGEPGRLDTVTERAVMAMRWCSIDPVCIESSGQGSDNANLAACHGCVLLPETSCELSNRLLDRALLVGTPDEAGMAFFPA